MKRQKHNLSHYKLLTLDMGELVPVSCYEVLPGDTVQQHTSFLMRLSPLMAPVMHPVNVRVHSFYVPNRILWDGWEDFITGGPDGTGTTEPYPVYNTGAQGAPLGSILDYMGVPPQAPNLEVCSMPIAAYNRIFNEYFRDQDLVPERADDDITLARVAWGKDYFTAARPWPQKGPEVTIPLGTEAPVALGGWTGTGTQPVGIKAGGVVSGMGLSALGPPNAVYVSDQITAPASWLTTDLSNASAANINELRLAFALQRYQEARARYGSRYTEYLRYLGVRSSDARLQRPEYLGGGKQTISFSEVLVTGTGLSADDPVGTMKGHGIAALRSRRFRRFFEEHGYVITLMSVRPKSIYVDGLHRSWSRRTKEAYWQKELEHIGQQEVMNREVYAKHSAPTGLFGYGDRYSEYKSLPSQVAADFRNTLDYWHMGRMFAADPALNQTFTDCNPTKRIFAEQTQDALWVMANNNIVARRMVSKSGASFIY